MCAWEMSVRVCLSMCECDCECATVCGCVQERG